MSIKCILVQVAIVAITITAIDCQFVRNWKEITPDYEVTTAPTPTPRKPYMQRINSVLKSNYKKPNFLQCATHCMNVTFQQLNDILAVVQEVNKECSDFSLNITRIKEKADTFFSEAVGELVHHACRCNTSECYNVSKNYVRADWKQFNQMLHDKAEKIRYKLLHGNDNQSCAAASRRLRNFH